LNRSYLLLALTLIPAALGCRSAMGADRAKEPKMSGSADDARNYTLTFRSEMDRVAPGVFAYMTVIRVDGMSGRAAMMVNRHNGNLVHPVGLFGTKLAQMQVEGLAAAIDSIKWGTLPQPTGGDINAATLSIDYAHGSRIIQRTFNARNAEFVRALSPVMSKVDELGSMLIAHPQRAVEVAVVQTASGFRLILRNVGTGPVMIADPRQPGPTPGTTRGAVKVAEWPEQADFAMAIWKSVALQSAGNAPDQVTISPGKTFEVDTVAWTPATSGRYVAEGSWKDYVGPAVDPKAVMPMLPDRHGAETDARPYVVRGAVFGAYLNFKIEKRR
jgi:hypothetical protein